MFTDKIQSLAARFMPSQPQMLSPAQATKLLAVLEAAPTALTGDPEGSLGGNADYALLTSKMLTDSVVRHSAAQSGRIRHALRLYLAPHTKKLYGEALFQINRLPSPRILAALQEGAMLSVNRTELSMLAEQAHAGAISL